MLPIEKWPAEPAAQKQILARCAMTQSAALTDAVRAILDAVRARGDEAVREYTSRFDGVQIATPRVESAALKAAYDALPEALRSAMQKAKDNITAFHEAQRPQPFRLETMPGVRCALEWRAIESVGLYVPGGTAPLFSSVFMLVLPALLAGCRRVVLCAPPQKDGCVNAETLAAAWLCGLSEVYAIGGAQAIAAMAFGTQTVPKVDKILGPGNAYVTMAKQLVAQDADGAAIDMPAGPSEAMVLAGAGAKPAWVAADLLAQAEHDGSSQVMLLTCDEALARAVNAELEAQCAALPRAAIIRKSLGNSRIILAADTQEAIAIANLYAPEHLILHGQGAEKIVPSVRTAGSVFVGDYTPETAGDYASGTNHVLPTYGAAKAYSGLSLFSFLRSMSVQAISREGLAALAPILIPLAESEGLTAHAQAVRVRVEGDS